MLVLLWILLLLILLSALLICFMLCKLRWERPCTFFHKRYLEPRCLKVLVFSFALHSVLDGKIPFIPCVNAAALTPGFITTDCFQRGRHKDLNWFRRVRSSGISLDKTCRPNASNVNDTVWNINDGWTQFARSSTAFLHKQNYTEGYFFLEDATVLKDFSPYWSFFSFSFFYCSTINHHLFAVKPTWIQQGGMHISQNAPLCLLVLSILRSCSHGIYILYVGGTAGIGGQGRGSMCDLVTWSCRIAFE